jgi:hypothetical protein
MGLHLGWLFAQGSVLGFPVGGRLVESLVQQQITGVGMLTGGAYGPEGGLVGLAFRGVLVALVLGYLRRRYPENVRTMR